MHVVICALQINGETYAVTMMKCVKPASYKTDSQPPPTVVTEAVDDDDEDAPHPLTTEHTSGADTRPVFEDKPSKSELTTETKRAPTTSEPKQSFEGKQSSHAGKQSSAASRQAVSSSDVAAYPKHVDMSACMFLCQV